MAKGIIVMTAMPPSEGHAFLVDFASRYMEFNYPGEMLHVIICARPHEPISGEQRAIAFRKRFRDQNVWVHHRMSFDPQYQAEHPQFWDFWRNVVTSKINSIEPEDILFTSDSYGVEFAKQLGCRFIPCDPARGIIDVSATQIRTDPVENFGLMMPEFSDSLRHTVTFFGAESTGKTSMSKYMAKTMNGHWCHEWARPYLEMCGAEVTDEKMANIIAGQHASQMAVAAMKGKPFVFQDTDYLSTVGYYRIYGGQQPEAVNTSLMVQSDLYIVMNSAIPFEPDALRYGGDRRESSDRFWTDILEEHGKRYHMVRQNDLHAQRAEIRGVLQKLFHEKTDWSWFKREK
jgi:HTH-type transcriptional repressor of NAD biosynthesis genes